MRKVLSLIAMALVVVGLTGCLDNPDGSKQTVRNDPAKVENPYK